MDLLSELQRTLGDTYTIERELDGGGMSRVFVALEKTLDRRVVIKTLSGELGAPVSAERFRREIKLAASLQQANIVPVHSAGEVDGVPYYTMPFVDGESLRAHIAARGALPVADAVGILRDIGRALQFAHERGVVHRDIKPENVLLSGRTAVVTDFGIAKAIEDSHPAGTTLTHLGTALGTPGYISPEQAVGDTGVDYRADIYALGVVAYELLTGALPFDATSARALIAAHISQPPTEILERRRDLPPALASLVMRCLEKEPGQRPQSASEVLKLLELALRSTEVAPSRRQSIAVLPFVNIGGDAENEYFSDGVTDDLTAQIARIRGIKVISRNSAMRFRNSTASLRAIADELSVDALVTGSVRKVGKRVRVVAELMDPRADDHLWTETYDRELEDIFAVQSDVAIKIAGALESSLLPSGAPRSRRTPTRDMQAYELYLLGRHHWNKRNDESLRRAIGYFQKAIERDPEFAAAHAGLADAYVFSALGYAAIPPLEAFAEARTAAARALALDEMLAEAHTTLGLVRGFTQWDNAGAIASFERAIALNPNHAAAHQFLAWFQCSSGEYELGLRSWHRAMALDPMNASLLTESGWPYCYAQLWDLGAARFQRALEMDPDYGLAHYNLGLMHHGKGRYAEAIVAYDRARDCLGGTAILPLAWQAAAYAESGQRARSEELLAGLVQRSQNEFGLAMYIGFIYDALGDSPNALAWLEKAFVEREPFLVVLAAEGWLQFRTTRRDPAFQNLLRRIGLSPHDVPKQRALVLAASAELSVR